MKQGKSDTNLTRACAVSSPDKQQKMTPQSEAGAQPGGLRSILKTSKYKSPFEQSKDLRKDRNGNDIPGQSNKLQRPTNNRKGVAAQSPPIDPNSPMKTG